MKKRKENPSIKDFGGQASTSVDCAQWNSTSVAIQTSFSTAYWSKGFVSKFGISVATGFQ